MPKTGLGKTFTVLVTLYSKKHAFTITHETFHNNPTNYSRDIGLDVKYFTINGIIVGIRHIKNTATLRPIIPAETF